MGNRIIKGRNENYNLIKYSLNSASTNSEIYDKKIFNLSKLSDNKKYLGGNKSHSFEIKKNNFVNKKYFDNNNEKKFKIYNKNIINFRKNKIIDLSFLPFKSKKPKNIFTMKLLPDLGIKNIGIKKNKLFGLYTEYDSKINYNQKNYNIQTENIFKRKYKNNTKGIDIKFSGINKRTKILNFKEFRPFSINNSALESSRFINYDITKERKSFKDAFELTNITYLNKTNKNKLIKDLENQNNQNDEMEFEDYISKLNSADFNIDEQLSDRPLLSLINKYLFNSRKSYQETLFYKSNLTLNSIKPKSSSNYKMKDKINSLKNAFKNKNIEIKKILVKKVNNLFNINKKVINKRKDIYKSFHFLNTINDHKTELSTSSNYKSKLIII